MKKTIFLSLPMKGREDEAIESTIKGMKRIITAMYPDDELEFVDNYSCKLTPEETIESTISFMLKEVEVDDTLHGIIKHQPLLYLGNAIKKMAKCDYIAEIENYNCGLCEYSGCYIESEVAYRYGLKKIVINDPDGSILIPDIKAKVEEQRKPYPKEEACCCGCNN